MINNPSKTFVSSSNGLRRTGTGSSSTDWLDNSFFFAESIQEIDGLTDIRLIPPLPPGRETEFKGGQKRPRGGFELEDFFTPHEIL